MKHTEQMNLTKQPWTSPEIEVISSADQTRQLPPPPDPPQS